MSTIVYLATLLSIHAANSYILLTANLDDFQAIGKQIAASPVGVQLQKIVRRASDIFNQNVNNKPKKRADARTEKDGSLEAWIPDKKEKDNVSDNDSLSEKDEEYLKARSADTADLVERRAGEDEVVALGKNASYYLQSLKKIFESV